MGLRVGILIAIDGLLIVGLAILLFVDAGKHVVQIIADIGLISYVSYSIVRLRATANAPRAAQPPAPPADG